MQNYEVIVFCGGKCGGTTLSRTFQKNNNFNLLHMHSLTCNGIFNDLLGIKIKDYEIINIIDEISKNTYKHNNKCYQFKHKSITCNSNKNNKLVSFA